MRLEIVTPEKNVFSGEVDLVQLPGSKGSFEILKNHAPIISTLDEGQIKALKADGEEVFFPVKGGVVEFKKNVITVLADNL
ncbi:MAG: ATP synthase F1 subunit epsilon [Marinifilaceae bacterium]